MDSTTHRQLKKQSVEVTQEFINLVRDLDASAGAEAMRRLQADLLAQEKSLNRASQTLQAAPPVLAELEGALDAFFKRSSIQIQNLQSTLKDLPKRPKSPREIISKLKNQWQE
mmetsp:Transcript_33757/g.46742  ORF Transcript_33757/g.46742 Transcript_33757/m.46742 type:complete len:113 (-) Transcript_33757:92-430(-)|eukprot:CAMPEP_0196587220 /NCGR_PEP_ID=MMETSP1081-20130531/56783_1 /TAXON_ID=36882 /ORGANISM="Pyramimonas amylifera, Strain CCMP720" /LENGTH=112 /DNA_ID=CAMNT_0041909339 /DNA_START=324 /DNA_END=662 /DNA_ORIENTATION=+